MSGYNFMDNYVDVPTRLTVGAKKIWPDYAYRKQHAK
jgi:hypothetical protein